ncbi:MAG: tRNA isopentenyl-2-thiomethyl-A-37 hydroxylase MiaE [Polyangiales bacterium]
MSLLSHYPDRAELVAEMISFAQEELDHFAQVMAIIADRGLVLRDDTKDPYVGALREQIRNGRDEFFLDRLIVAGIVEARGCERFGMVAKALPEGALKQFYERITKSEARHHGLFVRLAKTYFPDPVVDDRLDQLLVEEATIVRVLPFRAALH